MQLTSIFKKLYYFITPLKALSTLLILLAVFNHLYNPFEHFANGVTIGTSVGESIARTTFMFCGIFGFLGNGRTKRIRAILVSFPFLYLGIFFFIAYIMNGIQTLISPMLTYLVLGLWAFISGARYE